MTRTLATTETQNPPQNEGERPVLSVIIPVYNDAQRLAVLLPELSELPDVEVIIVDGGSSDSLLELVAGHSIRLLKAEQGRGQQLAVGLAASQADWIWFLHADSQVDMTRARANIINQNPGWGRFRVHIEGQPVVSWFMNQRSCISGICTGDQGIYAHRKWLDLIGGMPQQALMEDIELSKRLRRLGRPRCLHEVMTTDGKRWRERGTLRCIVEMWWLRIRYFLGADPDHLAQAYYRPQS